MKQSKTHLLQSNKYGTISVIISFVMMLLPAEPVLAGEVKFTPSIGVKESYSDNILLASRGQEQGEFVTEITPAFSLQMNGNKFNANVDYTLQDLRYLKVNDRNRTYSQLNANSTAELISDSFYFDVNAYRNQQIVDADQPIGFNNIAVTTNLTNVTSYSLSPYYEHRFGNTLEALVRFTSSEVNYGQDNLTDSRQNGSQLRLNSPDRIVGVTWALDYSNLETRYDSGNTTEFKRASISLGYRFTPRFSLSATSGKEDNSFAVSNNQDIKSTFWNADMNWQIGSRDTVSLGYGERYFGKTQNFRWQHSGRRVNLIADYQEDLSNYALTLLQTQQTANANSVQNQQFVGNTGTINTQTYVRQVGSLNLGYSFSKTTLSLLYSDERRIYQGSNDFLRFQNASLSLTLRSSSVLSYQLGTRWFSNYTSSSDFKTSNTYIDFSIQRGLSPALQAELKVSRNLRRSNSATTDYSENIVSIGFIKTFN